MTKQKNEASDDNLDKKTGALHFQEMLSSKAVKKSDSFDFLKCPKEEIFIYCSSSPFTHKM